MRYVKSQYFNVPKTKLADISNAAQLQHSQHPPAQKIAAYSARRIFIVLQLNNRPVRGKILLLPPTIQQKFFWENALSILEKAPAKCAEAKIIFLRSFYIKYFFRKNFSEKNPPDRKTRADFSIRCGAILPFLFRSPSFKLAVGDVAAEKSAFILNQPGE